MHEDEHNYEQQILDEYKRKFHETQKIIKSHLGNSGWWVIGSNSRRGLLDIAPISGEINYHHQRWWYAFRLKGATCYSVCCS